MGQKGGCKPCHLGTAINQSTSFSCGGSPQPSSVPRCQEAACCMILPAAYNTSQGGLTCGVGCARVAGLDKIDDWSVFWRSQHWGVMTAVANLLTKQNLAVEVGWADVAAAPDNKQHKTMVVPLSCRGLISECHYRPHRHHCIAHSFFLGVPRTASCRRGMLVVLRNPVILSLW